MCTRARAPHSPRRNPLLQQMVLPGSSLRSLRSHVHALLAAFRVDEIKVEPCQQQVARGSHAALPKLPPRWLGVCFPGQRCVRAKRKERVSARFGLWVRVISHSRFVQTILLVPGSSFWSQCEGSAPSIMAFHETRHPVWLYCVHAGNGSSSTPIVFPMRYAATKRSVRCGRAAAMCL